MHLGLVACRVAYRARHRAERIDRLEHAVILVVILRSGAQPRVPSASILAVRLPRRRTRNGSHAERTGFGYEAAIGVVSVCADAARALPEVGAPPPAVG